MDGFFLKFGFNLHKICDEREDESTCRKSCGQFHKNGAVEKFLLRKLSKREQVKDYMKRE
jgi:hypothetical protein